VRCEAQLKAVGRRPHRLRLERCLAGPDDPLEAVAQPADRSPAAVRLADEHRPIAAPREPVDAAVEARAEREARALVDAVHTLQADPRDGTEGLVAHEDLALEGPELRLG